MRAIYLALCAGYNGEKNESWNRVSLWRDYECSCLSGRKYIVSYIPVSKRRYAPDYGHYQRKCRREDLLEDTECRRWKRILRHRQ